LRLRVEDRTCFDHDAEHLLQAERLGAELNLVIVEAAFGTLLVLYWPCREDAAPASQISNLRSEIPQTELDDRWHLRFEI